MTNKSPNEHERWKHSIDTIVQLSDSYDLNWDNIVTNATGIASILRDNEADTSKRNKHVAARRAVGIVSKPRKSMYEVARELNECVTDAIDAYTAQHGPLENTIIVSGIAFALKEIVITLVGDMRMAAIRAGEPLIRIPTEERLLMIIAMCAIMTRDSSDDDDDSDDTATSNNGVTR